MTDLIPAVLRRLGVAMLACAGSLLPLSAAAQAVDATYIGKGCSGCHSAPTANDPPEMAGLIDFSDATLFSSLANWLNRITKPASNQTMRDFGNGVTSNATERQNVYDYLVNVRNAAVTASGTTFAATDVGVTSATTRTVTLVNYRSEALNFTPSLSNSTDFSMTTTCPSGPRRVAAQSSCTISVTFTPTQGSATSRSSDLTIDFTSGTTFVPTDRTFSFSGTVNPPVFSFTANGGPFSARIGVATDINFGTVRNTGSATLVMSSITENPASAVFSLSPVDPVARPNACSGSTQLADNGTCQLWVRFTAVDQNSASATFRFSHNAASSPNDVGVSATGTQPLISPTSASLDFGSVQQGSTSTAQTVVLNSTGNMAFTFTADPKLPAARSGTNPTDFAVTTSCNSAVGQTVAAGASCTISVNFSPPLAAPAGVERTATLTVNTDADNNGGVLSVSLRGTPSTLPEPTLVVNPATDFPDTVIGQSSSPTTRQIVITNPRTHTIGYSFTPPTDFQTVSQVCSSGSAPTVPANGGTCTVTMAFTPGLAGGETRRTATIPFSFTGSSGDPDPGTLNASLAGRALFPLGVPTSLSPNAGFGIPTTSSALLSNRSPSAIVLGTLAFSGAAAGDYSLDATNGCTAGLSLASGTSCTLVVRFDPTTGGTRNATLTITHNALGSPQAIALNGSATQGAILLSTFTLTFPDTALNANAQQSITVQNNGSQALNFSAFNFAGPAAGDYTRGGNCAVGTPLAIGAQCTVSVTFQPAELGTRSASLTILSDASNGPATVTLTGTGVPIPVPVVTLAPTSLDFGTQTVGNLYPTRTIRLSNTGTADLHTSSVVVQGSNFSTASVCPSTLAPGAGCDVQIQFTPLAANTDYAGTLRVVSDAAGSPHTAPLSGRGSAATFAALTWSPLVAELDLGTVAAGSLSAPQTVTLLNQGPGGVTLTLLNAVGADASSFAVTGGTCAVGAPLFEGQTCTIQVQFAPFVAGVRHAQLQVASTGSFPPTLTLTGTGLGGPSPGLAVSAAALAFDDTRVGNQSLPRELRLASTGSGVLRVMDLAVTGPYMVQSKSCPSLPFTLAAGSECTISVSFVPTAEGAAAGSLRVTTDATPAATDVALSGRGEAKADLASGGCSIASGDSLTDPTLWLLVLAALAALVWRRHQRAGERRAASARRGPP